MSIQLIIQGTPVNIPESGDSPDWAPAIDTFCQLVTNALAGAVGPFDVSPQTLDISGDNPGTVNIPNLSFPTTNVRAAFIKYSVYRTTNTNNASESGNLQVTYNPNNSIGNKWEITRDFEADGQISFAISDVGQVSFTTLSLPGTSHTGILSYSAQCLLQS